MREYNGRSATVLANYFIAHISIKIPSSWEGLIVSVIIFIAEGTVCRRALECIAHQFLRKDGCDATRSRLYALSSIRLSQKLHAQFGRLNNKRRNATWYDNDTPSFNFRYPARGFFIRIPRIADNLMLLLTLAINTYELKVCDVNLTLRRYTNLQTICFPHTCIKRSWYDRIFCITREHVHCLKKKR